MLSTFSIYHSQMRVYQWIKNVLIFLPLFFSGNLLNFEYYFPLLMWFLSFCFFASSIYVVNDLCDIEKDKQHPKKKNRPIASGMISRKEAFCLIFVLIFLALIFAYFTNFYFIWILLFYFFLNLLYSLKLKHLPIRDIFSVSIMYFLRVLAWAYIIDVYVSSRLFIIVFFGAMFLISAKRYAESISDTLEKRKVLEFYNDKVLSSIFILAMGVSLVSYILYTFEKGGAYYFYSMLFIVYIFLKYLFLVFWEKKWEEPERILVSDVGIIFSILGWLIFSFYAFYYHHLI